MNKNIELKDEITLDEYKAWLTGLLRGKGNQLPDLKDWKAIKQMTDKIVPDVIETTPWTIAPTYVPPATFDTPSPNWWENQPTCGSGNIDNANNITISNGSSFISMDAVGVMEINGTNSISIGDEQLTDGVTIGYSNGECAGGYGHHLYGPYGCPPALDPTNHYIETTTEEHLAQIAKITNVDSDMISRVNAELDVKTLDETIEILKGRFK